MFLTYVISESKSFLKSATTFKSESLIPATLEAAAAAILIDCNFASSESNLDIMLFKLLLTSESKLEILTSVPTTS